MTTPVYNFVISCSDNELAAYCDLSDSTEELPILQTSRGDISWCLRAYLILKKRGNIKVACSNTLQKGAINIIHSDQLSKMKGSADHFIVCVQADFPKRPWAHYHLVHNKDLVGPNKSFIPFWVQPKLQKRDKNRDRIERVAYSGQIWNGNLAGNQKDWKKLFEAHGIEFVTISEGSWHNLTEVDVLIGIRSFDNKAYKNKPATKLVNAWHANIPFIGGNDSAFRQLGTPGEDFLIATTPKDALMAVLFLRNNMDCYQKLITNGRKMAEMINNDSIALMWEKTLAGDVLKRFETWQTNSLKESWRFKFFLRLGMSEHYSKQYVKMLKKHSIRLLGNLTTLQPQ